MTSERTDYRAEAARDAMSMAEDFTDNLCAMWRDDRTLSIHVDDYDDGDSRHGQHKEADYNLREAAEVLDQLRDHEETDEGLWESLSPRDAISAQAAYTYAAAVYAEWKSIIQTLQGELEEIQASIEDGPAPVRYYVEKKDAAGEWERAKNADSYATREGAQEEFEEGDPDYRICEEEGDHEEAVSVAGERYIRLYFVLDGMEESEYGGMAGAARTESESGEFTAALALADAIQNGDSGEANAYKAGAIRTAVK